MESCGGGRCLCAIDLSTSNSRPQNGTVPNGGTDRRPGENGGVSTNGKRRKEGKRRKSEREAEESEAEMDVKMVPMKSCALFVAFTGAQSLLVVEKEWTEVLKQLPAPMYYHKYGT